MGNKVQYNLRNVHYAILKMIGDTATYEKPKKIPGAVKLNLEQQGEITKFYADGITYYQTSSNNGYEGDMEMALFPKEFMEEVLKQIADSNGVIIEDADAEVAQFALLFEVDGDEKSRRFCYYNCVATRPTTEYATLEEGKKEPVTSTSTVSATPLPNGMIKANTEAETEEEVYKNWFNQVYMKDMKPSETNLSSLGIAGVVLTPTFSASQTNYEGTTSEESSVVIATAQDSGATIQITLGEEATTVTNGEAATWKAGSNALKIKVTKNELSKEYDINVTKA